ncbi:ATP-dependent endonuclease [bacterium]|nr:ATP-dependent endonuclease [bacterium]
MQEASPDVPRSPVLLIVEGTNDVEFLKRLSRILNDENSALPDLGDLDESGRVIFVPFGGGNVFSWATRFAPLNVPEFHLFDRECGTETTLRIDAARAINLRPNARAFVTTKRSIENYVHSEAIAAALGVQLAVDDGSDMSLELARTLHQADGHEPAWCELHRRDRKRLCHRAKRKLNSFVVSEMTGGLLQERDRINEVIGWLTTIGQMLKTPRD